MDCGSIQQLGNINWTLIEFILWGFAPNYSFQQTESIKKKDRGIENEKEKGIYKDDWKFVITLSFCNEKQPTLEG